MLWLGMFAAAFLPVLRMPVLERKLWIVILLTLGIGLQVRTWDYRKPLWLILGVLAAHGVSTRVATRRSLGLRETELGEPDVLLPASASRSAASVIVRRS